MAPIRSKRTRFSSISLRPMVHLRPWRYLHSHSSWTRFRPNDLAITTSGRHRVHNLGGRALAIQKSPEDRRRQPFLGKA